MSRHNQNLPFNSQENYFKITCDRTTIVPTIEAKIDQGFSLSGDRVWTCYRKNYFAVSVYYSLAPWTNGSRLYIEHGPEKGEEQIQSLAVSLAAAVDGTTSKRIELLQDTPMRQKGFQLPMRKECLYPTPPGMLSGHSYSLNFFNHQPGPLLPMQHEREFNNSHFRNYQHRFERIQFTSATANKGKLRARQQYYHLLVELWANVSRDNDPQWIKIAAVSSQPVIVRGRSPGHFSEEGPPHLPQHLSPHITQQVTQNGLTVSQPVQISSTQDQRLAQRSVNIPPPRTFEPVKYPMEDLQIKQPRLSTTRPSLKFFSDDVPKDMELSKKRNGILMKSMGPLLCTWNALNVHDTMYILDSFTFDDFVDAMRFSSEHVECELLTEVHCSVLKQVINDSGKLLAPLPQVEDSGESEDKILSKGIVLTYDPTPLVRTLRNSLRKSEANAIVKHRSPTLEPPKQVNKAAEFLAKFPRCPVHKKSCDEILTKLVPPDKQLSVESISLHYVYLDVNLRITALDLALQLTISTEAFRDRLVSASQEMTRLRKEKVKYQKKRTELVDELFKLDDERNIQLPLNMPPSPTQAKENLDTSIIGTKDETDAVSEVEEEPQSGSRKLRFTKKNKRKREADLVQKENAKKAKAEAAKPKQQQEWGKSLSVIEKKKQEVRTCEANIAELDNDLRESLLHRSKVLGKDRFLNRYYWFERNGMSYGGVPTSSTSHNGYANGRLWVQGPDEHELQPNLKEPTLRMDMQELDYTVPQRKDREEGDTHLQKSTEWAY